MTIKTYCAFNYGHTVTQDNQYINFSEGAGELSAVLTVGSYTLGSFVDEVSTQLNKVGGQEYTVSLDRTTRKISISASGNFELLISSGSQVNISAYSLMGFTGADLTGTNSYEGDSASGSQFIPQFLLQNFTDFPNEQRKAAASINEAANGDVEVISYGDVNIMSANITLATDIVPQFAIRDNPNGVGDLRDFMIYATNKRPMEFIYDFEGDPNTFENCILESTPEDKKGTAFKLKELYTRNLAGYFETGNLQFRKITL